MPAHVADSRGTGKAQKHTLTVKCATCPQPLSNKDRKVGNRRCGICRAAIPGRLTRAQVTHHHAKGGGPGWRTNYPDQRTVKSKPKVESTTVSWWMLPENQTREAFMATAYAKYPSMTPPSKFNIARSQGGKDGYS